MYAGLHVFRDFASSRALLSEESQRADSSASISPLSIALQICPPMKPQPIIPIFSIPGS
jgi:hypothetical protein